MVTEGIADSAPRIGVLAVQGAFVEHERRLRDLGCEVFEIRSAGDARRPMDGLVLPGGESTVQAKLMAETGICEPLARAIASGLPVLGTCAGLILLARTVEEESGDLEGLDAAQAAGRVKVKGFGVLPVTVRRNAYGRQLGSFRGLGIWEGECAHAQGETAAPCAPAANVPLTFIRAPRITAVEKGVETLVSLDSQPVAVRFGFTIAAAFHPELDDDERLYRAFLAGARAYSGRRPEVGRP